MIVDRVRVYKGFRFMNLSNPKPGHLTGGADKVGHGDAGRDGPGGARPVGAERGPVPVFYRTATAVEPLPPTARGAVQK